MPVLTCSCGAPVVARTRPYGAPRTVEHCPLCQDDAPVDTEEETAASDDDGAGETG